MPTPIITEVTDAGLDTVVGGTAVTSPIWTQVLNEVFTTYLVAAGGVLLTLRCLKAFRDWRLARQTYFKNKREEDAEDV